MTKSMLGPTPRKSQMIVFGGSHQAQSSCHASLLPVAAAPRVAGLKAGDGPSTMRPGLQRRGVKMSDPQSHADDCRPRLGERLASGAIDRRRFLQVAALLGVTTGMGRAALAQAKEIVLANAGGDAVTAMGQAYGEPYMKQV